MALTYLLDVNVLIALFDPKHAHHEAAHNWFVSSSLSLASCPITENGFVRILSNNAYRYLDVTPAQAALGLQRLCEHPGHVFWSDTISLRDDLSAVADLTTPQRVTDFYLAALARSYGGRLATLDQRIKREHAELAASIETLPLS